MDSSIKDVNAEGEPYRLPPIFREIGGIFYSTFADRQLIESIAHLPVTEGDVFVATYPKSGTAWVLEIMWQVCTKGEVHKQAVNSRIRFLEMFNNTKKRDQSLESTTLTEYYRDAPEPRIFKVHLGYGLVPKGEGSAPKPKYIYVIRNPKDVAVSFYHHMLSIKYFEFDRTWDEFFELMMNNKVPYGSWFDHVLGWWEHRDDPNILFLKYEDMKKDLEAAVRQIAAFLNKNLSAELILRIASQTTFSAMKDCGQYDSMTDAARARLSPWATFDTFPLRKGTVGDWRNYFTAEQNRQFDELYANRMAGTGLEIEF